MGGQVTWAKEDRPLEVRTPESVMFAFKRLLISEANLEKRSLWVDLDDRELKFGDETVMTTAVVDNKLHIVYGTGWDPHRLGHDALPILCPSL